MKAAAGQPFLGYPVVFWTALTRQPLRGGAGGQNRTDNLLITKRPWGVKYTRFHRSFQVSKSLIFQGISALCFSSAKMCVFMRKYQKKGSKTNLSIGFFWPKNRGIANQNGMYTDAHTCTHVMAFYGNKKCLPKRVFKTICSNICGLLADFLRTIGRKKSPCSLDIHRDRIIPSSIM